MYELTCFFCHCTIKSDFWDELEEHVMACRAAASPVDRGTVATMVHESTRTVDQEVAAVEEAQRAKEAGVPNRGGGGGGGP